MVLHVKLPCNPCSLKHPTRSLILEILVNQLSHSLDPCLHILFEQSSEPSLVAKTDSDSAEKMFTLCSEGQVVCCLSVHRAMMMTACDLSAITKPWEVQSKVRTDDHLDPE